jgi:hypothetical protein
MCIAVEFPELASALSLYFTLSPVAHRSHNKGLTLSLSPSTPTNPEIGDADEGTARKAAPRDPQITAL